MKILGGTSTQNFAQSTSTREIIAPKLEKDTILKVSSTFGQAFAVLDHGNGKHEPIEIEMKHRFKDFSEVPMPARKKAPETHVAKGPRKQHPDIDAMRQKVSVLLAAKRKAEAWDGSVSEEWEKGDGTA